MHDENSHGTDLSVVNAARVSYNNKKELMDEDDIKLLNYLAKHGHTSPFRHAFVSLEVYAPLMIARQWWKHVVGSDHVMDAWNESSRRYIKEDIEFYIPEEQDWREAPEDSKQGSGKAIDIVTGRELSMRLLETQMKCLSEYDYAIQRGVCAEQARLFLPANGLFVRWYWSSSLQSVAHLINLREEGTAQKEFQVYAKEIRRLVERKFPLSLNALLTKGGTLEGE